MGTTAERSAVFAGGHLATVSDWMTPTVAARLEFHELVPYKNLLKRFFSAAPWTDEDGRRLSDLVAPKLHEGWGDTLQLGDGLVVSHGVTDGRYWIAVEGAGERGTALWDRVFEGPVIPEATPHPRKVRFDLGGEPAPGTWYRRGDEADDERVRRLFAEPDVTDVMVAGDFVTVGLDRDSSWEERLDAILELVTSSFPHGPRREDGRSRDELVAEGRTLDVTRSDQLHLLDPDHRTARPELQRALEDDDPRVRRVAVAVLAESADGAVAAEALRRGFADVSRNVRRTAIDAAADREEEGLRDLFEAAVDSGDAWLRWRAVRALGDIGIEPSRGAIERLASDPDFQVRFEAERVLRRQRGAS